jgi:hypothetical protein
MQSAFPSNTWASATPDTVIVNANTYEAGRANIIIYNGDGTSNVTVTVGNIIANGSPYTVRDVMNWHGTVVASGTYNGSTVSIPMGSLSTVTQPIGDVGSTGTRTHSAPYFGMFVITGTEAGEQQATPTITVSTTSLGEFVGTDSGAHSASLNYTVSGSDLTANITVTAPTGFEVSTDNSNWYGSRTLTQSGGTVNSTTIYARFSPTSSSYFSGNITHASTGATTRNVFVEGQANGAPPPDEPVPGRKFIIRRQGP